MVMTIFVLRPLEYQN